MGNFFKDSFFNKKRDKFSGKRQNLAMQIRSIAQELNDLSKSDTINKQKYDKLSREMLNLMEQLKAI